MDRSKVPAVLSIAGSDSSGGAGIQADIKTITAHRLYAETAITAITAQNTLGVTAVQNISPISSLRKLTPSLTIFAPTQSKSAWFPLPRLSRLSPTA